LTGGSVLSEADEPLDRVYFVDAGVVSLATAFENRITVGVAAVGREGAVGVAALLLGGETALGRSRVLVSGSARAVEVSRFRSALRKSVKLRAACEASARALFVQMLQSVPCNRLHTVEQRCARWLLVCADLTEGDTFELSQECFAEMLGVPQSRSPGVVRKLQHAGLISCASGATTLLDRRELEAVACECYRIVRNRHEGLLARHFG
jgi:CRP-like cAMP-binding protein